MKNVKGHANCDLTEAEAIRRAQGGDAAGFEHLYRRHGKRVYSCLRMVKNTSDAEDLTQQTFLNVFRKIGRFLDDSGFSTCLYRAAVNAVLIHLRRKRRTEIHPDGSNLAATNFDVPREFGAGDISMLGAMSR